MVIVGEMRWESDGQVSRVVRGRCPVEVGTSVPTNLFITTNFYAGIYATETEIYIS